MKNSPSFRPPSVRLLCGGIAVCALAVVVGDLDASAGPTKIPLVTLPPVATLIPKITVVEIPTPITLIPKITVVEIPTPITLIPKATLAVPPLQATTTLLPAPTVVPTTLAPVTVAPILVPASSAPATVVLPPVTVVPVTTVLVPGSTKPVVTTKRRSKKARVVRKGKPKVVKKIRGVDHLLSKN